MRKYTIKKGHHPDLRELVSKYFGASGDATKGITFRAEGIGDIFLKQDGKALYVDITPIASEGDYSLIKKWNDFLHDATGRSAKERRKMMTRS
jgi:hypothetical protein